eukprot:12219132-Alexandrium_andersonii.AAC.1
MKRLRAGSLRSRPARAFCALPAMLECPCRWQAGSAIELAARKCLRWRWTARAMCKIEWGA